LQGTNASAYFVEVTTMKQKSLKTLATRSSTTALTKRVFTGKQDRFIIVKKLFSALKWSSLWKSKFAITLFTAFAPVLLKPSCWLLLTFNCFYEGEKLPIFRQVRGVIKH
jgi:hypothetical protein